MIFALIAYASAMTVANMLVATFGPSISPLNAFVFIGFDLALRDWLQIKLQPMQMGALIIGTGLLTYALDQSTVMIATASAVSFIAAALIDWIVFTKIKGTWLFRSNSSNVAGAMVDSLLFPTIAFGGFMPEIVAMQFVAKIIGGAIWVYLLNNYAIKEQT